jgi:hypothetical protein
MAKGQYCAPHNTFYGPLVPCELCLEQKIREHVEREFWPLSYEEWCALQKIKRTSHSSNNTEGEGR